MRDKRKRHWMIDLETIGGDPSNHPITSFAAIEFNPRTCGMFKTFECAVLIPNKRYSDMPTALWRQEHPEMYEYEKQLPVLSADLFCAKLLELFSDTDEVENILWAKPAYFDMPFVILYINQILGIQIFRMPWHYRNVRDLRSYIEGLNDVLATMGCEVPWEERARHAANLMNEKYGEGNWSHIALRDCEFQIYHFIEEWRNG